MSSTPIRTRAIAEAKAKTDKVHAEILARLLAADFVCAYWVRLNRKGSKNSAPPLGSLKETGREPQESHSCRPSPARHNRPGERPVFRAKGRQFLLGLKSCPRGIVLTSNLKVLKALETKIAALEKINLRAKTLPGVELLLGIPGIDVLSALTIPAEIGGLKRFASGKKLASFASLVPSVHQSGRTK